MTPTPHLPDEILLKILVPVLEVPDELFCSTDLISPFSKYELSSAGIAAVCKDWYRVATPLLYHTVVLRSKAQAHALYETVKKDKHNRLVPLIKRIRLEEWYGLYAGKVLERCGKLLEDLWITTSLWSNENIAGYQNGFAAINPRRVILVQQVQRQRRKPKIEELARALITGSLSVWTNLRVLHMVNQEPWAFSMWRLLPDMSNSNVEVVQIGGNEWCRAERELPRYYPTLSTMPRLRQIRVITDFPDVPGDHPIWVTEEGKRLVNDQGFREKLFFQEPKPCPLEEPPVDPFLVRLNQHLKNPVIQSMGAVLLPICFQELNLSTHEVVCHIFKPTYLVPHPTLPDNSPNVTTLSLDLQRLNVEDHKAEVFCSWLGAFLSNLKKSPKPTNLWNIRQVVTPRTRSYKRALTPLTCYIRWPRKPYTIHSHAAEVWEDRPRIGGYAYNLIIRNAWSTLAHLHLSVLATMETSKAMFSDFVESLGALGNLKSLILDMSPVKGGGSLRLNRQIRDRVAPWLPRLEQLAFVDWPSLTAVSLFQLFSNMDLPSLRRVDFPNPSADFPGGVMREFLVYHGHKLTVIQVEPSIEYLLEFCPNARTWIIPPTTNGTIAFDSDLCLKSLTTNSSEVQDEDRPEIDQDPMIFRLEMIRFPTLNVVKDDFSDLVYDVCAHKPGRLFNLREIRIDGLEDIWPRSQYVAILSRFGSYT
ncbi:hypothetical protein CC2G_007004 [Coprinopsis cinerea AmutBmut pab1-1]|nr:hypothetical protein CC2G_007004 [Coprinopsis cinerea AmutBmut pab1-1]